MSEKIDVTADGGWAKLAQWFAFAMCEAVCKPTEPTGVDTHVWTVGDDSWQLADVMSSGSRSVVTRWRKPIAQTSSAAVYESVIVKFIRGGDATRDRVNRGYFDRELAMLQEEDIARSPHFAHIASFARLDDVYIAVEDCGAALSTFNIRGAAGRELATVVHRDIWAGALPVLNRLKLCHFDITENNIVVSDSDAGGHAKLIDLESMTEDGKLAVCPTATTAGVERPKVATIAFDEQCVCAILQCLSSSDISSFAARTSLLSKFADPRARAELINSFEKK
jgi:hypothetical protein